jgi:molybdopterin molybdotransferase
VAFFDNGDELVEPGATLRSGQIIGANRFALAALIRAWGGEPRYLGRARDDLGGVRQKFQAATDAEILVAIGGASVGDHDYVRPAFESAGGKLVFSKIAVKPGKPTWFGRLGMACVLGLPGNPASAIVCAALFLRPLIEKFLGTDEAITRSAIADTALPANGPRETYLRARFVGAENGLRRIAPFDDQDSSLLAPLAAADALIRRPANAPVVGAGDELEIVRLL